MLSVLGVLLVVGLDWSGRPARVLLCESVDTDSYVDEFKGDCSSSGFYAPAITMSKSTQKSSTVSVVLKKPAARPSGTPWPVLYKRLENQGDIDRARIAELTSQLTSVANDNDKLKEKLRDVVAERNRLHEECMMHNAGGLAFLSGEVPARRRC